MKHGRYPFYVSIATLVVSIVVSLTAVFLWISHRESRVAAVGTADRLFAEIDAKIVGQYEQTLELVAVLAGTVARVPGMAQTPQGDGAEHPGIGIMLRALTFYPFMFSTYIGYADGSFIQSIAVGDRPELRALYEAPAGTFYVLRAISSDPPGRRQHWRFLDADHAVIGTRMDPDSDYDPRERPWYREALQARGIFFTSPYVFSSSRLPGITCAVTLQDGGGVFGVDMTLEQVEASLKAQRVSDNGRVFLFDRSGNLIAHPTESTVTTAADGSLAFLAGEEAEDPLVRAVVAGFAARAETMRDRTMEIIVDGRPYLVRVSAVRDELRIDQVLASVAPVSDFTAHIRRMLARVVGFSMLALLVVLPSALMVSRAISRPLVHLEKESERIRRSDFSDSEPFDSRIWEIHSLIMAFALMRRTIRGYTDRLIQAKNEIEALFTAVTELLAGTIDAKSPYTGGHCKRVPVLARMLAEAAHESQEPPFADFRMDTEDKRREFEVAAWLHDCGKITTPEHVVDKATKLETIYNRIHEVRMRFEVLLRDAEIEYFRNVAAGGDESELRAGLEAERARITADFAFVAECNIGGEAMDDARIARLREIAERTWTRRLDDRLGISRAEADAKGREASVTPAVEHVLADKAEHVIPRHKADPYEGNAHGFNMVVPEHERNLGELYNLGIRRGTLTAEERFTINEHIVQTILMLKRLPFPPHMRDVAEIAGSHHETMDGTGYPRGLRREDMSIPARIMAIADIFEALTAADRPYKKSKTFSESLRIMSGMRDKGHIDADLFELFLRSGVFRAYAERYLDPMQMDEVDLEVLLGQRA
jgi:HD-GYP domain-containing protein (c-di-GMP phosphodiesterase class II)